MYYKNIISEMRQSIFYNTSLNENTLVNGVPYKVYVNFLDYIINYFQNDIEFNCFYNTYIQYSTVNIFKYLIVFILFNKLCQLFLTITFSNIFCLKSPKILIIGCCSNSQTNFISSSL